MIVNYRKLRDALEGYSVCKTIKDATGNAAVLTVSAGSTVIEPGLVDSTWIEPGAYLAIRLDTVEDVEKLAKLIIQPMTTLRQRVLAIAAEVAELDGLDNQVKEYYASLAGAVSAHIDYEATREEAEKLQEEIDHLKEHQQALISGMFLRNNGCEQ